MFLHGYLLNLLAFQDVTVLLDLFQHKNIHNGVIYHCYDSKNILLIHKIFNENNVRVCNKGIDQYKLPLIPDIDSKVGVILNTSCDKWMEILDSANEYAFQNYFAWFIVTDNITDAIDVLSQYKIELDSDMTIISKRDSFYVLHEAYNTGFNRNGRFIVREVGQWNGSLKMDIKDRRDLKGLVLRNMVVIPGFRKIVNETFVEFLEEAQPDLIKADPMHMFKGFAAYKYFQDMFNISYEYQRTNSWGYPTNGTFDGLVGSLQRDETDVGGSPLFVRSDRMDVLDYAATTWLTKPNFIFRHPKHADGYYTIYTRPLTTQVWWCVLSLTALSAVVLGSLLNLHVIRAVDDDEDVSWSLVVLLVWSAVCQQGATIRRSSNSVKIVMFTTFLFALTLYQYYNATVVSTLLRELPKDIKTLSDLLASNLKAGVEDVLYAIDYFKHTKNPAAREIFQKKVVHVTPHNYFSPEHGMALVKRGGFAFHVDNAVAYRIIRRTFTETELCELQEIPVFGSYLGLGVAKRSPYKEIIAYGVRRMSESGLSRRLRTRWDERRPPCERTSALVSVSLREFSTALAALALGAAAALLLLLAEILTPRLRIHVDRFRNRLTYYKRNKQTKTARRKVFIN